MARLVASFPEWISSVEQVGTTRQGRPINLWCVGPGGCSTATKNLPAIMYTALVHAREPATLMCLVHALRKLLGDAAARVGGTHRLLASRKLLFMPIAMLGTVALSLLLVRSQPRPSRARGPAEQLSARPVALACGRPADHDRPRTPHSQALWA